MSGLSTPEINAEIELINRKIGEVKLKSAKRALDREIKKTIFDDLEDQLLDIGIESKKNSVEIAKTKLEGERENLKQGKDNLAYLRGKTALNQTKYFLELSIMESELSGSKARLEEIKKSSAILGITIESQISSKLLGGSDE